MNAMANVPKEMVVAMAGVSAIAAEAPWMIAAEAPRMIAKAAVAAPELGDLLCLAYQLLLGASFVAGSAAATCNALSAPGRCAWPQRHASSPEPVQMQLACPS